MHPIAARVFGVCQTCGIVLAASKTRPHSRAEHCFTLLQSNVRLQQEALLAALCVEDKSHCSSYLPGKRKRPRDRQQVTVQCAVQRRAHPSAAGELAGHSSRHCSKDQEEETD